MELVKCLMKFFREEERMVICFLNDQECKDWSLEVFEDLPQEYEVDGDGDPVGTMWT